MKQWRSFQWQWSTKPIFTRSLKFISNKLIITLPVQVSLELDMPRQCQEIEWCMQVDLQPQVIEFIIHRDKLFITIAVVSITPRPHIDIKFTKLLQLHIMFRSRTRLESITRFHLDMLKHPILTLSTYTIILIQTISKMLLLWANSMPNLLSTE